MSFKTFFRVSSYAMVACGTLALTVSGGLSGALCLAFALLLIVAWKLEGTKWQLSERAGLVIVLLSLPLFYFDWRFLTGGAASERLGVSALAHLILFLSAVKLLQVKADRDWAFLYLISFFEVLLSAGLSLSPLFLLTLSLYMLFALSTILAFEIRKAQRSVKTTETRLLVAPDSTLFRRLRKKGETTTARSNEAKRLPLVSFALLLLIFGLALPLFLIVPRSSASALARTGDGGTGFVGFSDNVSLGAVGRLQESDRLVMRVRVENGPGDTSRRPLRWRGVALDYYNGHGWQRTAGRPTWEQSGNERGFFQLGTTEGTHRLTAQTFYVEAIDTPVLFAAPRVVAVQGALPFLRRDGEGALSTRPHFQERISYKVYSDTETPSDSELRKTPLGDVQVFPAVVARYLQLPDKLDPRISRLAHDVIKKAGASNQYDAALAIEKYLQSYDYTLDLKASGPDPLADFLFNVKAGHCEYFATAMAVMLRTQGIPARVVNGFQTGDYNETADVYTVTQRDAHSWVEVYFPDANAWVTFDPTPLFGRPMTERTGIKGKLSKYAEALEMLWLQYVVGYDSQEQRSLAKAVGNRFNDVREWVGKRYDDIKGWLANWISWVKGGSDDGSVSYLRLSLLALIFVAIIFALVFLIKRIRRLGFWRIFKRREVEGKPASVVEFYERMTKTLATRGLERAAGETPLEFATALGMPEALNITRAYNRVRYGDENLSPTEAAQIEEWLKGMEGKQ